MKKNITLHIDCAKTKTPAQVHAAIAHQLHFPDYYGANLDALQDCLGDTLIEHTISLSWHDTAQSLAMKSLQEIHSVLNEALGKKKYD